MAGQFYGFNDPMQSTMSGAEQQPNYYYQGQTPVQTPTSVPPTPSYPISMADQTYHGYPGADNEMEMFCRQLAPVVPDTVVRFIVQMHRAIKVGNSDEILYHYESGFPHVTEQHYSSQPWPAPDIIKPIVNDGKAEDFLLIKFTKFLPDVFLMLYKELYHRHLLAKVQVNILLEFTWRVFYLLI